MKLEQLFENVNFPESVIHDLDIFLSQPKANLKASTKEFLRSLNFAKERRHVFRVLFTDDMNALAKELNVDEIVKGKRCTHSASRVSSWSASKRVVQELAEENDDLGDFAVILSAEIDPSHIILDSTKLSRADKLTLRNGNEMLLSVLEDQKEIILDAGAYTAIIEDVIVN